MENNGVEIICLLPHFSDNGPDLVSISPMGLLKIALRSTATSSEDHHVLYSYIGAR